MQLDGVDKKWTTTYLNLRWIINLFEACLSSSKVFYRILPTFLWKPMIYFHVKVQYGLIFLGFSTLFCFSIQLLGRVLLKEGHEKFAVDLLFKDDRVLLTLVARRDECWVDKTREPG